MTHFNRFPLVSLLALGIAMPAMGQNTPAQPAAGPQTTPQTAPQDDEDRDIVVVTAQKREETVQDIAVAVTAITSELRDEIGLTTVQDYTNFAPGLSYSTAVDRLGMRGVTRTSNNFGIRSGISNYVDGVYFSSAIPASREPILIDRVEVVRGPQGTLYGRDSIGGALNVITKRPTDEFEAQANFGIGNYENMKVEMTFSGPINDWLRYRVSGIRTAQNEGYLDNYSGLTSEGGRKDDLYVEAQLEGEIGDRFDWWVRGGSLSWDTRMGAPGARTGVDEPYPYNTRFFNSTAELGPNGWFGLADPSRVQVGSQTTNPSITDRYGFNTDFTNFAHLWPTQEYAIEGVFHADNFDIKYLGGYVWYHYNLQQDQDGTAVKRFTCTPAMAVFGCSSGRTYHTERVSDYNENRMWYSNEINFISTWDGPFQAVAGLYQYQENYNQIIFVSQITDPGGPISNALTPTIPSLTTIQPGFTGRYINSGAPHGGSLMFRTNNQGLNNAYGAFIQGDYQLNDQWKFTAGIRWSQDNMDTREYARVINHYTIAGLFGLLPLGISRMDVTGTLGGPDPATISAANPCGLAGQGVVNTNVTPANSTGCPTGNHADKSRYGVYYDQYGNSFRDIEASWEEVTGVLGVDWTPDDDTLIYGKYNRGYKPGGLGCAATFCTQVATPYTDKELIDAFELGFKRDWREWDLITNATLFYYDYQGYQVSNVIIPDDPDGAGPLPRPGAFASYVNLPETVTTGFELETIWTPTDDLRFLFNYGYTNPEIGQSPALVHALDPFALDPAAQPLGPKANCAIVAPATYCNGVQGQSLDGNILPFSPKHKAALNATYTWDLEDGSTIDLSGSYFWQDIAYSAIFNRSYTKIPSWDQINSRISWTSSEGDITLIGFVRNLLDEVVYDNRGAGLRETASTQTADISSTGGATRYVSPTECFSTPGTTQGFGVAPNQSCYTYNETLRPPITFGAELQFRF